MVHFLQCQRLQKVGRSLNVNECQQGVGRWSKTAKNCKRSFRTTPYSETQIWVRHTDEHTYGTGIQ